MRPENAMRKVTIYTDGGCSPNPGPGGWGVVILPESGERRELFGGEPDTTNNRMEMTAALQALRDFAEPTHIDLYTDSNYLKNGVTKWMAGWRRNGWMTKDRSPVKNRDLWEALDAELGRHEVAWHWTKGHAGDVWNERADVLATAGISEGRRGGSSPKVVTDDASVADAAAPRHAGSTLPLDDAEAVHAFLEVAYSGRLKAGAWAVALRYHDNVRHLNGRVLGSAPNRLHVVAAVEALRALKRRTRIHVYTRADYLKDGATQWLPGWKRRGWRTSAGGAVTHRDAWEELDALQESHDVSWHVVDKSAETPDEMSLAKEVAKATLESGVR